MGDLQPATGKTRPGRKRQACIACSSTKQKCDGATRHPCRRCELYSISCEYPDGQVPRTAVRVQPVVTNGAAAPTSAAGTPGSSAGGNDDVAAALRDLSARLTSIEAGLEADRRAGLRPVDPSSSSFAPPTFDLPHASASSTPARLESVELPADTNPLQVLVSTMEQMSRDEGEHGMDEDEPAGGLLAGEADNNYDLEELEWRAKNEPRSNRPDAFARQLVSFEDVHIAFTFYVQRIQPWIPVVERRSPLVVREKAPFLFHVILLVTNYYNTSTTPRAREVYDGLNSIVHELLVGHILAPDPIMFTRDLVRAFLLLLYYKPIQTAAYAHRGLKSSSRIVHASKINALSSLMLHSLIQRAAIFISVPQSPTLLTRVLDNFEQATQDERKRALAEFRLWCTVVGADALGSLQSGRLTWTDPTSALRITRRFAAFAADPTDVRRAAILELYSIVTLPTSMAATSNPVRYRLENLNRINAELDAWRAHWAPLLAEMQTRGDPLAYTVVQTSAQFVILAVNGAVFTRWDLERKKELEQGKEGRPRLTTDDWQHLHRAAQAAETAIFIVSTEATAGNSLLRESKWPAPTKGFRAPLNLDPRITEDFKTALDTMTCIAFVYSLLFLVRMASAGLITCDIETRQADYEAGCDLDTPQPLATGQKLPCLLELGAAFLTGISPNPDHPARRHALLVDVILRVGLTAASPQTHGAPSPASNSGGHRRSPIIPPLHSPSSLSHIVTNPSSTLARASTFPSSSSTTPGMRLPSPFADPSSSSSMPPPPVRPPVSSFDSWLWDSNTPSGSFSGPLRMQDGSFVMPDLSVATSAAASSSASRALPAPVSAPTAPSQYSTGRPVTTPAEATALAAGAGRKGDAAQAMASLLSEVNPFLDDFYSTQPGIGSHAFNDDFGLGLAGGATDGALLPGLEWTAMGLPGAVAGAGAPAGSGGAEGQPWSGYTGEAA
ncbi:hypothetical protein JCM9279_007344 [Rhodotorula babjevae]